MVKKGSLGWLLGWFKKGSLVKKGQVRVVIRMVLFYFRDGM